MAYDLAATLSPPSASKIRALITSGSPLRKFVDLLAWGNEAGNLRLMNGSWLNFWDERDQVADPLAPALHWKRGERMHARADGSLFIVHDPDTGHQDHLPVQDILVDNVRDSRGIWLRAHNYWDNDAVCTRIARVLADVK